MSDINKLLKSLGFGTPKNTKDKTSIGDIMPKTRRCGIYVLHLPDNIFYVGQAVNVVTRYLQHKKSRHPEIEKISFKAVSVNSLDTEERSIVNVLEANKFRLNNILLVTYSNAISEFNDVMSEVEQEKWLTHVFYNPLIGERKVNEEHRSKTLYNNKKFLEQPQAEDVMKVLKEYIRKTVPAPYLTERDYWSCSCLPSSKVYFRINIFRQEVLTAYFDEELSFSFHLAKDQLPKEIFNNSKFGNWFKRDTKYGYFKKDLHYYPSGGANQMNIVVKGVDKALKLLDDPDILLAIRFFNLAQMRKGINLNSRSHNYSLADIAFT